MDSFLKIESAFKSFRTPEGGVIKALDDVSLHIRNNEFLTLLGPSGCGKTTLLKCIAGFEDIDDGVIELQGQSLKGVPAHRRPFNTVFQNYALFPHLSVAENVAYGLTVAGVEKGERGRRVGEALDMVGLSGLVHVSQANFQVVSSNVSRSRAHWSSSQRCSCLTNRFPPWIVKCVKTCRSN